MSRYKDSFRYNFILFLLIPKEIVDSVHTLALKYKDNPSLLLVTTQTEEKTGVEHTSHTTENGYDACRALADNAWPSLLVLSFVLGKARHEVLNS